MIVAVHPAAERLLERDGPLAHLRAALADAGAGCGRVVLVTGEAGIGKTALLRQLCAQEPACMPALWGCCEALFTPRPLGPLIDVAFATGAPVANAVERGTPHEIARALLVELGQRAPGVLVLDDVHWADEATLDVVRLIGRRIEEAAALVVVVYRDDELHRSHPLRIVLGELARRPGVTRLKLEPLSPDAVAALAEPYGADPVELFRITEGNPFFVTEALAARGTSLPETVRDAVLARAAHLREPARALLDAIAVVPQPVELSLLETVAGETDEELEECLGSGILVAQPRAVAFRHELARRAIESAQPPDLNLRLHRAMLTALAASPAGEADPARLAHHAEQAGDAEAVQLYAPRAAEAAAARGAHREAAAQYARAVRFADALPSEQLARLLERRSFECYLTDQFEQAIEAQRRAVEVYRELGDVRSQGAALCSYAKRVWCAGNTAGATQACWDAIELLGRLPRGRELAQAYGVASSMCMNDEDAEGTVAWGTRAIALAEELGDAEVLLYTLNNVGTMQLLRGERAGIQALDRSLRLAEEAGLEDHVGRAYIHFAWVLARNRDYALENRLRAGLDYCSEHGLDLWWLYLQTYRARSLLDRGRWDEAADLLEMVLGNPRDAVLLRTLALAGLGLLRARRGDPGAAEPLDDARRLATAAGELSATFAVAIALAETAWLSGRQETVATATEHAYRLALDKHAAWVAGELACWRRRAGLDDEAPAGAAEPFALELAGRWEDAALRWSTLGCPYDAALALAGSGDVQSLRRARDELLRLGARPAAAIVSRRLRHRGVKGLRRGPLAAPRANQGLTARELEVLRLVAEGLQNGDIARRLFLSPRTVDHHVSAILRKLDAKTRGQASASAARLGLLEHR